MTYNGCHYPMTYNGHLDPMASQRSSRLSWHRNGFHGYHDITVFTIPWYLNGYLDQYDITGNLTASLTITSQSPSWSSPWHYSQVRLSQVKLCMGSLSVYWWRWSQWGYLSARKDKATQKSLWSQYPPKTHRIIFEGEISSYFICDGIGTPHWRSVIFQ